MAAVVAPAEELEAMEAVVAAAGDLAATEWEKATGAT
jgi:hypothetical protein